jgi:DNA-binding response OmpR family regulator
MPQPNNNQKKKAYLLLIEDDPQIAFMYKTKLTAAGYKVEVRPDGPSGWEALTTGPRPDLLLLDIVLPRKDGFEILRDLRRHPTLHDLKVILLTNLGQEADVKEGKRLGADDYIIKARITPQELVDKIKQHL